jgi:hypothetical protein
MERLCELLIEENAGGQEAGLLQLPELYRELGQFADAERAIERVPHDYDPVARKLIADLISERKSGPVRFRY